MPPRIYLDHAATTPLDPRALEAMLPYLTTVWGNPASIYQEAREARRGLDTARRTVAELLGARPAEIVFTAGGSESDSLAIRGSVAAARRPGAHAITTAIEHHAVLHTVQALERDGVCRATYLPVDREGFVDPDAVARAVGPDTVLVSVMLANNEVGAVQPLAEIARSVKRRNPHALVHTDAVQAAGALDLQVDALGVDLLSLAGHKFYGPKGTGVLYVRRGTRLTPQILGGGQEKDRRAGTENVAGAAGLAAALRLAVDERESRVGHEAALRDRLLAAIPGLVPGAVLTGPLDGTRRLPNNASCCIPGAESGALLMHLDLAGVAASSGSACTTGSLEPSHVLLALGIPPAFARGSLRLTVGKDTTASEVERLLEILPPVVERLRALGNGPNETVAAAERAR